MSKELGKPQSDSDVVNKEPRVLLIGYGWVNQFCGAYFKDAYYVRSDGILRKQNDPNFGCGITGDHWDQLLSGRFDLAIIGVPTPMNPKTGECDIRIVEESVAKYKDIVDYFLIKSTVEIGTTDYLRDKYQAKIAMSPEYVGETLGHPLTEPKRDTFLILGGEDKTTQKISEFWRYVLNANSKILLCEAKEAEVIKYCENYWIMQRVDFWNDVYEICDTFGIGFDTVREGLLLDPRLGRTHSFVYPNNRGWSGKCLPKDMNSLANSMRKMKRPLTTLENQIEKNVKVRKGYQDKNKLISEKPLWKLPKA